MKIVDFVFGMLIGGILCYWIYGRNKKKMYEKEKCLSDKHLEMFLVLDRWIQNIQDGKNIGGYLTECGVKTIIIYGMNYLGKRLYKELIEEGIEIKYLIDQRKNIVFNGMNVKQLEEKMDPADVVIVTSIYYFEEIERELKIKFTCPIISLADIIYKV